jgi:4-hydroxy-4-methyl-2-oxoglutarate aldolase
MVLFPPSARDPLVRAYLALSTPNVSDALDRLGIEGAPRGILPLWPGSQKLVGRAVTMKLVPVDQGSASPVLGTLEAIKAGLPGSILVIDQGGRTDVNSLGGVATFTAVRQGLIGAVIDGVTRDVDDMKAMGFAVYAKGIIQQSIRNRCAFGGHSMEVQLSGVPVSPGDLVMADDNGVVVVTWDRVQEVLEVSQGFAETEERIKDAIAGGVDPVEAHQQVNYDQMTRGG